MLLFLNVIFPVVTGCVLVPFNVEVYKDTTQAEWIVFLATFAPILTGLMQIISGVFLMAGVYTIRRFFKAKGSKGELNVRRMVIHASAFGLYLLSDVVGYSSYTLYVLNDENQAAFAQY